MADFFDVVFRQRACRSFADRPVADALVEQVLRAATHAPSAENRQPWVFVVVRDAARRAAIGDLMRRAWHGGARRHSEARLPPGLFRDVASGADGGVADAPVLVVVGGDAQAALPQTLPSSVYPAVQNLLLAATALGLGSALTTLATAMSDELRAIVGLPAHVIPMAVVPLGWPARPLGPPTREPLSRCTHRETYGCPW